MANIIETKVRKGSDEVFTLIHVTEGDEVAQCDQYGNIEYSEFAEHDYFVVNYGAVINRAGVVCLSPYSQYTFSNEDEASEFLADY